MARLLLEPYPLTRPTYKAGNHKEDRLALQKQDAEFDRLVRLSEEARKLDLLAGRLFGHPVADGTAWYLIVKAKPFTLQWIPYLDAWQAPAYVLRGLRAADIR